MLKIDMHVTHSNAKLRVRAPQSCKNQVQCQSISSVIVSQCGFPQVMTAQRRLQVQSVGALRVKGMLNMSS